MRRAHVLNVLLALACADLLVVLVTHEASLLPGGSPATGVGFALRAAAIGLLLVLRFRLLPDQATRLEAGRLTLLLLLLPTLAQFQLAGGRLNGDGLSHYSFLRSLWKDFDLDLANETARLGLLEHGDLAMSAAFDRRSLSSVGPAVVWAPFFLAGEAIGRGWNALGGRTDLSGYGPVHVNAVCLGSLLCGFLAITLIHDLLRRHFGSGTALGAALLLWGATFLHWYMVEQPAYAHAASACAAALALWLWDGGRGRRNASGYLLLGLVLGVAMSLRWWNGVLLLLPALELLGRRRAERAGPAVLARGAALAGCVALAGGALIGALPRLAAWHATHGEWLPHPSPEAAWLRLDHPHVLETLFSSRHGLLSWTPLLWAGYLGFLPLLRRRPALAGPLVPPLVLLSYVNMCAGDWWAGGSYSNRRFDSLLPILAIGLAASLDVAREALRRRPGLALAVLAVPLVTWNLLLAEQLRRGLVPRDATVEFPSLVGNAGQLFADELGSPPTWPASWLFAWRHGVPPGQYDLLVGRYLFQRSNQLDGHIGIAVPRDQPLLAEGWGPIESVEGRPARAVRGHARLLAPLDGAEDLLLRVSALAPAAGHAVRVLVNGKQAGSFRAGPGWNSHAIPAGAAFWRRELNDVVFDAAGGELRLSAVDFERRAAP